jgi:hypothetical protein
MAAALEDLEIGAAGGGGTDTQQDLPRTGDWHGDVPELQPFGAQQERRGLAAG